MITLKIKQQLKKLESDIHDWAKDPVNRELIYTGPVQKLEKALSNVNSERSLISVPGLRELVQWHLMIGVSRILDGDMLGWTDVLRSSKYAFWRLRILRESKRAIEGYYWGTLGEGCRLFAESVVLSEFESAKWFGGLIINSIEEGKFDGYDPLPFERFIVWLYTSWKVPSYCQKYRALIQNLGPYNGARLELMQPNASIAIEQMCSYHVKRIGEITDSSTPEFGFTPFGIFPVEILSYYKIRKLLGIETSIVNNPLLITALASPPPGDLKFDETQLDMSVRQLAESFPMTDFSC